MRHPSIRLLAASSLALLVAGCVLPPEPYHDGPVHVSPGRIYETPGPIVYEQPTTIYRSAPIYVVPDRRDERAWREQEYRAMERERMRMARERERDWERMQREQQREQAERQREQFERQREQQRQQFDRQREQAERQREQQRQRAERERPREPWRDRDDDRRGPRDGGFPGVPRGDRGS